MPAAVSVAKEFVSLSHCGDEPDPLTPSRLHKLLYYAQGWSLVVRESCLFPEKIIASRHGPTVARVRPFRPPGGVIARDGLPGAASLSDEQAAFVRAAWESYRGFSATRLADLAHEEAPWRAARLADPEGQGIEIPREVLGDHFARQLVPAALAAHAEHRRDADKAARVELDSLPPLDVVAFRAAVPKAKPALKGAGR